MPEKFLSIWFTLLLITFLSGCYSYEKGEPLHESSLTGDIRIHRNFPSNILSNKRHILVYLPPGYSKDDGRKYPVLYLQDGEKVFGNTPYKFGLDETAEKLIRQGKIKPLIMVAIYSSKDRWSEYSPVADPNFGGGNLNNYADFVIKEVKPFIDKTYNTLPGPSDTAIMGSSMGGLCALYMGWKYHDVFGLVGSVSLSVWWSDKYIIRAIEKDKEFKGPSKIWLDMGTNETAVDNNHNGIPDLIDYTRELRDVLVKKGYKEGENLFYYEARGGFHNERSWSRRVDKILIYLFGNSPAGLSPKSI